MPDIRHWSILPINVSECIGDIWMFGKFFMLLSPINNIIFIELLFCIGPEEILSGNNWLVLHSVAYSLSTTGQGSFPSRAWTTSQNPTTS